MLKFIIIGAVVVVALAIGLPFALAGGDVRGQAANSTSTTANTSTTGGTSTSDGGGGTATTAAVTTTAPPATSTTAAPTTTTAAPTTTPAPSSSTTSTAAPSTSTPPPSDFQTGGGGTAGVDLVLGDSRSGRGAVRRSARFGSPDVPERLAPIPVREAAGYPAAGDPADSSAGDIADRVVRRWSPDASTTQPGDAAGAEGWPSSSSHWPSSSPPPAALSSCASRRRSRWSLPPSRPSPLSTPRRPSPPPAAPRRLHPPRRPVPLHHRPAPCRHRPAPRLRLLPPPSPSTLT